MAENSFDARAELDVGGRTFEIHRLDALQSKFDVARLPFSLKILLENLLRNEDGVGVRKQDIEASLETTNTQIRAAEIRARLISESLRNGGRLMDQPTMQAERKKGL